MPNLFRKEALEAKSESWYGDVLIAQPLSFSFLAFFAMLSAIFVIIYTLLGSYTRYERVVGILQPVNGISHVIGEDGGYIAKHYYGEGDSVKKGDVLYEVYTGRTNDQGMLGDQIVEAYQDSLVELTKQVNALGRIKAEEKINLKKLLTARTDEGALLQKQIKDKAELVEIVNDEVKHLASLYRKQQVSKSELNIKKSIYLQANVELNELEYRNSVVSSSAAEIEFKIKNLELQYEENVYAKNIRKLELNRRIIEAHSKKGYFIRSPISGVVSGVRHKTGSNIKQNQVLVSILPEDYKLEAHLYVPSKAIGFTQVNQRVELKYAAFPYQRFGVYDSKIQSISKNIVSPNGISAQLAIEEPVYLVITKLSSQEATVYGRTIPLSSGMLLEAHILGDRRSIFMWLLEPLYSLKGL